MLQPDFSSFPELFTERLLLRKTVLNDAPEVFLLRSDPQVLKYLGREPCTSLDEAKTFIELLTRNLDNNDAVAWAIALKDNPEKMIGSISYWNMDKAAYRSEIGYVLHPGYWKKGMMKEAILKVLDYGFNTLGLHSVEARTSPDNTASNKVLESAGFIQEGYLKESFCFRGVFEDTVIYSKIKS